MNNAVTAPALNPTWTCAFVASSTEHAWVLGSAGPKLIMARSTSTLHHDAGYMSELRFRSSLHLTGREASIYVQGIRGLQGIRGRDIPIVFGLRAKESQTRLRT